MTLRNLSPVLFGLAPLMILLGLASPAAAQQKSVPALKIRVAPEAAAAAGIEPAGETDQESETEQADKSEDESVSVVEQIQEHLKEGQPEEAAKLLAEALKSAPDSAKPDSARLRGLHQAVAFGFLRARDYERATQLLKQWFDLELPLADSPDKANTLAAIVQQMSVYGARGDQAETVAKATDQAIERCRELESEHHAEIQIPLSRLIGMRASVLARDDQASARTLIDSQLEKLGVINGSDNATEDTISAELNLLMMASRLLDDTDASERIENLFARAIETYPDSELLISQLASHEYSTILSLSRENPLQAAERMEAAVEKLTPYKEKVRAVQSILGRFSNVKRQIEAARKQLEMIGKPAPPLDIDGWANTDDVDLDGLQGKVVLYDFWAVWCGPCIATFPHLREWREEFGDQGFEIVGVTRYYGYSWDEENDQAVRAGGDVDPEVEREAVGKFLQSKEMHHATIFTPKDSELQAAYGVSGIPHAVLIDRQGNVQMVKVGSGQANADALHAKIKELITQ